MNANKEEFAYREEINNATVENGIITEKIEKRDIENAKAVFYIEKAIKRFIDIIGGLVGCVFLIPIAIGVKIANVITKDYGPIFLIQKRIGKNGKEFNFIKFRSMVLDADRILYEYLDQNEEARREFYKYRKLKNDPRITKVGHFIRNTSLDEVPQFFNVLKGDMSLVGPRPYMPREKEDMGDMINTITMMKPGITGLWQVSGRSETTFKKRLEMDRDYYYNWSLKEDIKIILKTIKSCVLRKGAI